MLKHPKATAFTEDFVGQWLGLREIDATEPSHLLYSEFIGDAFKVSFVIFKAFIDPGLSYTFYFRYIFDFFHFDITGWW